MLGRRALFSLLVAILPWSSPIAAQTTGQTTRESLFAVVTEKAGFAKGRAHDHLITAGPGREVELRFDPERPLETHFRLAAAAEGLVVDDPELRDRWGPRLESLGLLQEPFGDLDSEQRAKIRDSMLGDKQLDAQRHPTLTARLMTLIEQPIEVAGVSYPFTVEVEMSVRGQVARGKGGARIEQGRLEEGRIEEGSEVPRRLEAVVPLHFTDFGIEPFSAFLGAVKNLDRFFLYANIIVP